MLVLAVAGIDHRGRGPPRDELRGADVWGADHDRSRVVGRQRLHGVLERLALVDRGTRRAHADDVCTEALCRELERRAGPRARLIEEVDDRTPAEHWDLLDLPA